MNEILIKSLRVTAHVGVPDEERATAQQLLVDAVIEPEIPFDQLEDDLRHTVDYDAASKAIVAIAAEKPRRLIETLAAEIAQMLLEEFPAKAATVEIRKFILPETDYVAVRYRLEKRG